MWVVAGFTTIDAYGSVFKQEWPTFVGVTLKTRLFIGEHLIDHARSLAHTPGCRLHTVGIMAIGALDHTFVDPVLERHIELSPNVGVAAVADFALFSCQKVFKTMRTVYGVAIGTDDVVEAVLGTPDVCAREVLRMTAKTIVEDLIRLEN